MRKLYLIRHGQTEMNERNLKQGRWDSPLTQKGIEQGKQAAKYLEALGVTFDHAYSSPAGRACDTLELVTDLPYKRIRGLQEINFGSFEAQPSFLGAQVKPYGDYYVKYGGESEQEVQDRMVENLQELMSKDEHNSVIAASHGAACVWFTKKWYDLDLHNPRIFPVPNCTIFEFDFDPETKEFSLADIHTPDKQKAFLDSHKEPFLSISDQNKTL